MYYKTKVLIFVCACLSVVKSTADGNDTPTEQPPTQSGGEDEARMNGPNFSADFPQFTPFRSEEFFQQAFDLPRIEEELQNSGNSSAVLSEKDKMDDYNERIKPWKNFVMGLYQNYRSALANRTQTQPNLVQTERKPAIKRKKSKKKKKTTKPVDTASNNDIKYNIGPGVNVSLDKSSEMVNVYLDEDCLKDVFSGRGKKHDLVTKILPLFILPFLLQSAVLPFMVSTLKLLLIKSILAGKIAIFLLIVSALKNHSQGYVKSSYEPAPYYVEPPSRRSESDGYRVEGKPTTWIT